MTILRIDILPEEAQKEIQDFYEFLLSKYINNKNSENNSWQEDFLSVDSWNINEEDIKLKDWKNPEF